MNELFHIDIRLGAEKRKAELFMHKLREADGFVSAADPASPGYLSTKRTFNFAVSPETESLGLTQEEAYLLDTDMIIRGELSVSVYLIEYSQGERRNHHLWRHISGRNSMRFVVGRGTENLCLAVRISGKGDLKINSFRISSFEKTQMCPGKEKGFGMYSVFHPPYTVAGLNRRQTDVYARDIDLLWESFVLFRPDGFIEEKKQNFGRQSVPFRPELPVPFLESNSYDYVAVAGAADGLAPVDIVRILKEGFRILHAGGLMEIYSSEPSSERIIRRLLEQMQVKTEFSHVGGRWKFSISKLGNQRNIPSGKIALDKELEAVFKIRRLWDAGEADICFESNKGLQKVSFSLTKDRMTVGDRDRVVSLSEGSDIFCMVRGLRGGFADISLWCGSDHVLSETFKPAEELESFYFAGNGAEAEPLYVFTPEYEWFDSSSDIYYLTADLINKKVKAEQCSDLGEIERNTEAEKSGMPGIFVSGLTYEFCAADKAHRKMLFRYKLPENPEKKDCEFLLDQLELYWQEGVLGGLKVHLGTDDFPCDDVLMWMQERMLPVVFHAKNMQNLSLIKEKVSDRYCMPVLLSHFGGYPADTARYAFAINLMVESSSVYLVTSNVTDRTFLKEAIEAAPEKVLCGSDYPAADYETARAAIEALDIPAEHKAMVIMDNLRFIVDRAEYFRQQLTADLSKLKFPTLPRNTDELAEQGFVIVETDSMPDEEFEEAKEFWANYDIKDWYSEYKPWTGMLGEIVKALKPKSVLEVGCNVGRNLHHISSVYKEAELAGFDINRRAVDIGRKATGLNLICGDENTLQSYSEGAFDMTFTVSVLDHISDISEVCRSILHVTGSFGIFIEVTLPVEGRVDMHNDHKYGEVRKSTGASYSWFVEKYLVHERVDYIKRFPIYLHSASLGPYYYVYFVKMKKAC